MAERVVHVHIETRAFLLEDGVAFGEEEIEELHTEKGNKQEGRSRGKPAPPHPTQLYPPQPYPTPPHPTPAPAPPHPTPAPIPALPTLPHSTPGFAVGKQGW